MHVNVVLDELEALDIFKHFAGVLFIGFHCRSNVVLVLCRFATLSASRVI